ncbi:hypothetical protein VTK56DRAFT_8024 [Thermocarpiscus australiensis]
MTEGTLLRRTNAVPIAEELEDTDLDVAPPAYGEHHDQLQFSQSGFAADAAVTADGRVNIHISEKDRRLSELLAPTLRRQLTQTQPPLGPLPPPYIPPSLGGQPGQTPPPRLNVVIQIVGSRGDVQPFVALGQVLRDAYGHRVRLATHATFKSFVEENGLEFFNIGGDPAELMAFMVKNPGLMPGLDALANGDIKKRRKEIQEILMGCWRSCIEAGDGMGVPPPQHSRGEPVDERYVLPGDTRNRPFVADAIIANPPSFAHIHIAEKLGIPLHMMFTMPWTPTRAFPHPLADIMSTTTDVVMANYVSYALVEMMTWQGLGDVINRFRTHALELDPISLLWAPGLLNRLRVPTTYCWSPALTPKPADWAPEITVAGFYFLNLESRYNPDPELVGFLQPGPPPVYIGFGSIVVDDPDALTRTVFDAIARTGVRALVSKGWGGIGCDSTSIPSGVFMLGNCPHDWLFQHVAAVVHHGGAGTTAAGIRAGKPTVVVPFFGDQIFWGSMVAKAGAGPAPIPHKKLTAENLAAAIQEALRPETKTRARELGEKIKGERGADVGAKSFHQFLNTDNMRCSLAPSRVAVWRVRRTKIRLSALAAAVLVQGGWLKYSDLKLYRPVEYNTDEQPWDPISAVALALMGDIGALTMALADFPREIFKGARRKKDNGKAVDSAPPHVEDAATMVTSGTRPTVASSAAARSSIETLSSPFSATCPDSGLSSQQTRASTTSAGPLLRSPASRESSSIPSASATSPVNLDMAIGAGKGLARIVGAGAKFHTNVCLGLARGFRNAPKLYGDETVRPTEKVTGVASGLKLAGKEFGLGLYDGISGLVTQPWKGAAKEGGRGFVKGVGKGIGGLMLKPAAAVWSLPAYTFQGVQAEVRNMLARSSMNYIITSRVLQGEEDLRLSTAEEQRDILARWEARKDELNPFYALKQKEEEKSKAAAAAIAAAVAANAAAVEENRVPEAESVGGAPVDGGPPPGPVRASDRAPTDGRGRLQKTRAQPPTTASSSSSDFSFEDNEALERAIQQSVEQTSRGNREEDARVEAAVRASVMEMRRMAEQEQEHCWGQHHEQEGWGATDQKAAAAFDDDELRNISDAEYQALIEEAVRQSLLQFQLEQQEQLQYYGHPHSASEGAEVGKGAMTSARSHPSQIKRKPVGNSHSQMAPPVVSRPASQQCQTAGPTAEPSVSELPGNIIPSGSVLPGGHDADADADADADEDEQLRRAMEESAREHRRHAEDLARQRTEEEIVLDYVKRQSLAEEEFRRARAAGKGKGKAVLGGKGDEEADKRKVEEEEDEDEDEELRMALAESLRTSGRGSGGHGAGPSMSEWGGARA